MTREEAIADIKQCLEDNKWGCGKYTEAFCWAILALDEDCVIEDIRAEIANLQSDTNVMMYSLAISDALEIIDKHISGKENGEVSRMKDNTGRFCDRCGKKLTEKNNTCGYEICDSCNEILERQEISKQLISKGEALKLIEAKAKELKNPDTVNGLMGAHKIIWEMPSVETEKSAWRRVWNDLDGCTDFICRGCNNKNAHPTNYCPTCGRDMRGEHEIYYISWR